MAFIAILSLPLSTPLKNGELKLQSLISNRLQESYNDSYTGKQHGKENT